MERLTRKQSAGYDVIKMNGDWCDTYCNNQPVETCNNCAIYEAINKLAQYEDMEEKGLLYKLPVNIGEKCYLIGETECEICQYVSDESYDCKKCPEGVFECELNYLIMNRWKDIFSNKSDAETEYKKRKNKDSDEKNIWYR